MFHQLSDLLEDILDLGDVVSLLDTQFYCLTHTGEPDTYTESWHHVHQRLPCLVGFVHTVRGRWFFFKDNDFSPRIPTITGETSMYLLLPCHYRPVLPGEVVQRYGRGTGETSNHDEKVLKRLIKTQTHLLHPDLSFAEWVTWSEKNSIPLFLPLMKKFHCTIFTTDGNTDTLNYVFPLTLGFSVVINTQVSEQYWPVVPGQLARFYSNDRDCHISLVLCSCGRSSKLSSCSFSFSVVLFNVHRFSLDLSSKEHVNRTLSKFELPLSNPWFEWWECSYVGHNNTSLEKFFSWRTWVVVCERVT